MFLVLQIAESGIAGEFILWVLVENDLYQLRLSVPRLLFVNSHSNRDLSGDGTTHRNVSKILPRSIPVLQLCEYSIPEQVFQEHAGCVHGVMQRSCDSHVTCNLHCTEN